MRWNKYVPVTHFSKTAGMPLLVSYKVDSRAKKVFLEIDRITTF